MWICEACGVKFRRKALDWVVLCDRCIIEANGFDEYAKEGLHYNCTIYGKKYPCETIEFEMI